MVASDLAQRRGRRPLRSSVRPHSAHRTARCLAGPSVGAAHSIRERFEVFVGVLARGLPAESGCARREHVVRPPATSTFEHVVQTLRIRAVEADQRRQVGQFHEWRFILCPPRADPVAVALDRVDLAVVREQAERLRQAPARQRVGRSAGGTPRRAGVSSGCEKSGNASRNRPWRDHRLGRRTSPPTG